MHLCRGRDPLGHVPGIINKLAVALKAVAVFLVRRKMIRPRNGSQPEFSWLEKRFDEIRGEKMVRTNKNLKHALQRQNIHKCIKSENLLVFFCNKNDQLQENN